MSWEIQAWAEDLAEIFDMGPAKAGVLYVLARRCDESASCFPKQDHIIMSSRFKRTAVISALKSLIEEDGLVSKENRICPGEGRCGNADCRGGHKLGNRYYLQMECGEQFIAEAIMQGRVLPSGRHKSRAKYLAAAKRVFDDQVRETPGQPLSPGDGHSTSGPVGNLSPGNGPWTKTPGQALSPGNGHGVTKVREANDQSPGDGLPARDLVERAPVSNFQSNFHHSSSPGTGEYRPDALGEPTAAAAGEEEEPLRGAESGEEKPAASGHDAEEVFTHPTHGQVKLRDVGQALSAISSVPVTAQQAKKVAGRILDRASAEPKASPTGFVVSAIRRSTSRTKHDLAVATGDAPEGASRDGAGRPRPKHCAIPAHAALGHHQANCPECRDLTGEGNFPEAIDTGIYAELSEAGRKNIDRYRVPVHRHIDHEDLVRTVSWAERRRIV